MITISAPAKINLYLHATGRREDGYHLLDSLTVFARDVADQLTIAPADKFYLSVTGPYSAGLGTEDNLVAKAAQKMAEIAGRAEDVRIDLIKNIPMGTGLGGGSADAAATVKGLEELWGLSLSPEQRNDVLLSLGADVPVCYLGRSSRFEGVGDVIQAVPSLPAFYMVLVWPETHLGTKEVFAARRAGNPPSASRMDVKDRFDGLEDFISFLQTTGNDLTNAAETLSPVIANARKRMEDCENCLLARMTGSGSAVFGLFASETMAEEAAERLRDSHPSWWVRKTACLA